MSLTPVSPSVLTGAQVALFITDIEVPMSKGEIKRNAVKTDVTGSTSVSSGVVWNEFGQGPSGGTFNWEGHWRVGQVVAPPDVIQGQTYAIKGYVRRPGWNGVADAGSYWGGNLFIEDNSMTLDPKLGSIDWRVSGTFNGPITPPG